MDHVIVCREYPPAPGPPGGIGSYTRNIAGLMADAGETVHVIAQRWAGAPRKVSESHGGKLLIHRVSVDQRDCEPGETRVLAGLQKSDCPSQVFAWQAAKIAESLIRTEPICVIEGPEWEAPLYYLQVRRALGLGPKRQPPCLVHLHSPSELIFRHNEWDITFSDYEPLCRFEQYSVKAADALLCPSRFLAREAEGLFGLGDGEIQVIPYPLGSTVSSGRQRDAWKNDVVCFTGRLELRKGVVEWVDAAVKAARSHPTVRFEFAGGDTTLRGGETQWVSDFLKARIPGPLRDRFRFHGSQPQPKLREILLRASIAVVPSRWENLPYTCIEAMASGLPVLVSPNGGMAELVTDGKSGWIAPSGSAEGLLEGLRRALETPPNRRAEMGGEAQTSVRHICSNESVLERHMNLRTRLAGNGACRSTRMAVVRNAEIGALNPAADNPAPTNPAPKREGLGVVVTCLDRPDLLARCLASLRTQTQQARMVVAVIDERHRAAVELDSSDGRLKPVFVNGVTREAALDSGFEYLLNCAPEIRGVVFLSQRARLAPGYLAIAESIFENRPQCGLLSSFVAYEGAEEIEALPSPEWPAAFASKHTMHCVAVRTEAAIASGGPWAAVTYPDVLVSVIPDPAKPRAQKRYSAMTMAQGSRRLSARSIRNALAQPLSAAQWLAWQLTRRSGIKR